MSILMYKQRHRPVNYQKTPKCNYAHIGYIATRPGVVKNEGMRHGLFGRVAPGATSEFSTWQEVARLVRNLSYRRVNMYRSVISFLPETAAELGLTNHAAWEDYISQHIGTLAKRNGIRVENLQWVAAHHNERSHPHIHVVFWDKSQQIPKQYVRPEIPDGIRIQLIKDTFREKIEAYQKEKDRLRGELGEVTDGMVQEYEAYIKSLDPRAYRRLQALFGHIGDDELGTSPLDDVIGRMELGALAGRLFALKDKMPKKGRLYYKLLPLEVKAEVDSFVAALKGSNEYVRNLVNDYADSKVRLAMLYDADPEHAEQHRRDAEAEADKLIANKILGAVKAMLRKEGEAAHAEYTEARRVFLTEQVICEILLMLEQNAASMDEDYDAKFRAANAELSKAAKKEWYLKNKDQGIGR